MNAIFRHPSLLGFGRDLISSSSCGCKFFSIRAKNSVFPRLNTQIIRKCTTAASPGISGVSTKTIPAHANKYVGYWLLGCSGMVFGAVVLGMNDNL